jgi:cardiolipin synthase A/B
MKKKRFKIFAAITIAFYVAGIISAIQAVMTVRTPQGAIAWSVSLVSFPFVAVPAYLVFGRSKFEGMVQAYDARRTEIEALEAQVRRNIDPWVAEAELRPAIYNAVRRLTGMALTRGNDVELLIDGEATFVSLLKGIAQAHDYILFQFYMIHDDELGRRVQQALIERAKAGVRVYVLYDEVGSNGLPWTYVDKLRKAGVEVSAFKATQGARNRFQLNFRNHRKMVVVDGVTGWVGGHNVGDEYLGRDPEFSPWRDTHVRLEGPVVIQLQSVIAQDWYWATRRIPKLNWKPHAAANGNVRAMITPTAPTTQLETSGLLFVAALDSARERIWITAPYFVPDEAVIKALQLAALRGVDVRILTSGKGDSLAVHLAAFHYIELLQGLGIRFYAYQPGFLHEKVMLIDHDISAVGTANFDNRSFRLNFEVTAVIADSAFASQTESMLERDLAHAVEIDPKSFSEQPFWWRLGVDLSRLAAPVL